MTSVRLSAFFKRTPVIIDREDVPRDSIIEKINVELQDKICALTAKHKILLHQHNEVKNYYSSRKLFDHAIAARYRDHNPLWKAADLSIDEKKQLNTKFQIECQIEAQIESLEKEIKILTDHLKSNEESAKELENIKTAFLSAIRIAAEDYRQQCNKMLSEKTDLNARESFLMAGQIFGLFFPITFSTEYRPEGELVVNFIQQTTSYDLKHLLFLLNESIKNSEPKNKETNFDKELQIVLTCLNNSLVNQKQLQGIMTFKKEGFKSQILYFPRKMDPSKAVNDIFVKYEPEFQSLSPGKKQQGFESNQEIKNINYLINAASQLSKIFDHLKPSNNSQYNALLHEIKNSQSKIEDEISKVCADLTSSCEGLKKEIRNEIKYMDQNRNYHSSQECYAAYKNYKNALDQANVLKHKIERNKKNINEEFDELKKQFDGPAMEQERQDSINYWMNGLKVVNKSIKEADFDIAKLKLSREVMAELNLKYKKEFLIKHALKFLKDKVLSDNNIEKFWQKQTTTCYFDCLFGYKVRVGQGKHVVSPKGVGKMKDALRYKDLDAPAMGYDEMADMLFGDRPDSIYGIVKERLQYSKGRKAATDSLLKSLKILTEGGQNKLKFMPIEDLEKRVIEFETSILQNIPRLEMMEPLKSEKTMAEIDLGYLQPSR